MAKEIMLPFHSDNRGELIVIEKACPFAIRRVFYIHRAPEENMQRGGHRHFKNRQLLVSVSGSCVVDCDNGLEKNTFILDDPKKALLIEPEDFHYMRNFTSNAVLLVLASEYFDAADYIHEGYSK